MRISLVNVTFTKEILNEKLHFLCSVSFNHLTKKLVIMIISVIIIFNGEILIKRRLKIVEGIKNENVLLGNYDAAAIFVKNNLQYILEPKMSNN